MQSHLFSLCVSTGCTDPTVTDLELTLLWTLIFNGFSNSRVQFLKP